MRSGYFLEYCQVMFSINFIYLTIAIAFLKSMSRCVATFVSAQRLWKSLKYQNRNLLVEISDHVTIVKPWWFYWLSRWWKWYVQSKSLYILWCIVACKLLLCIFWITFCVLSLLSACSRSTPMVAASLVMPYGSSQYSCNLLLWSIWGSRILVTSRPSDETQIKRCHLERCRSGCSQFNAIFFCFLRSKVRFNNFNEENQTKGQPNFIAVSTENIKTVVV